MITSETTEVYVRVDLNTRRIIGVSDEQLFNRTGRPVFKVAANFNDLDYYVIESADNEFDITVRAATEEERAVVDTNRINQQALTMARAKAAKATAIKDIYDRCFISRFHGRGFYTTLETLAAANYEGDDPHMLSVVKPLGIRINQAYNEWRHDVCQPVIDAMLAGPDQGPTFDAQAIYGIEDTLDTFLTTRAFDVVEYSRR